VSAAFEHRTVLLDETLRAISPRTGGVYADATVGGGGHAHGILAASAPDGRLVGVDRDPRALDAASARLAEFGGRAVLVHGEMRDLARILADAGTPRVDGLVADLGVSSPQLEEAARGFAFGREGPLDMRMNPTTGETARELLERLDVDGLADVIYRLGEERRSRAIARSIKRALDGDELETTADLRRAVVRVTGPRRGRTDPSTRTFQAVRMAVNGEVEQLEALLQALPDVLRDGATAVVITFHSIEDRMVKVAFRGDARLERLTKKPIVASAEERRDNPRSRSAKLRAARRAPRAAAAAEAP
jgi:16S rRNA (cytosine1402-N4)-methyltransferase